MPGTRGDLIENYEFRSILGELAEKIDKWRIAVRVAALKHYPTLQRGR